MRTYPIRGADEHDRAFEIENAYVSPRKIEALLTGVSGITDLRRRRPFGSSNDIHLSFQYQGVEFVVWEPYGDNSRYWIGPKSDTSTPVEVKPLLAAFDEYEPSWFVKIFGDLISLNLRSLFHRKA